MAAYFLVAPGSKTSWSHDWDDFLAESETIDSRVWSITPDVGSPSPTLSNETSDVVFVEGFEAGMVYHLTEAIVTSNGVRDSKTIALRCDQS
jgi:hypothetical protein